MEAGQRYELLELTRPGSVETWAARDRSTGRDVSIHRLTGGTGSHRTLLERVRQLPEWAESEILDAGEIGTIRFFVTAPWLRDDSFEEWVIAAGTPNIREDAFAKAGTWRVPTVEFGRRAARPQGEPGEFTRMFEARSPGAAPTKPEPPPTPLPGPHPEPEEPQPATPVTPPGLFTSMFEADRALAAQQNQPQTASGGEFTRLFRTAPSLHEDSPTAEIPIAAVIESKASDKSGKSESGEFTRMLDMPHTSSEEPAVPDARESVQEPGPFTRMFRAVDTPAAQQQEPDPPTPPAKSQPGTFTQMFRAVQPKPEAPAQPSAPPAAEPAQPGTFTQMFPAMGSRSEVQPPPTAPSAAPPGSGSPQPGTFTQMFQAVQPVPAPQPDASLRPGAFTGVFPSETFAADVQPPPAPTAESREPGEFTKTFRMPSDHRPTEATAPSPPTAVPISPQPNEPGEFTRNFRLSGTNPASVSVPTPDQPPTVPVGDAPPFFQTSRPGSPPLTSTVFPAPATLPQAPAVPAAHATTQESGEFTRIFQTSRPAPVSTVQVPSTAANSSVLPTPVPVVPESPKAPAETRPEAGEFTRMFQTSRPVAPQSAVQVPGAQPPPEPGEFTRMFQTPQSAPPSAVHPPQASQGPGEFTRMFQSPSPAPPPATTSPLPSHTAMPGASGIHPVGDPSLGTTHPAPPSPLPSYTAMPGASGIHPVGDPGLGTRQPAPPPVSSGPGEFTRMFEIGSPQPQNPAGFGEAARFQQPPPSDFDKHFNPAPAPVSPAAHPAYKDPLGANRSAGGQEFGQPGEFTRMFGIPSVPPAAGSQPPSPPVHPSQQPAPPPQPVMGTYTKMFSASAPPLQPAGVTPQAAAPAAPHAVPQQQPPGSFTTVIPTGASSEPPASVLVKPPGTKAQKSAQRRSSGKSNYTPLYILLGVLIVAVVFLIVVLLFR